MSLVRGWGDSYGVVPVGRGSKGSSTGCDGIPRDPRTPLDLSALLLKRVVHL
jgi:hypothetical protein